MHDLMLWLYSMEEELLRPLINAPLGLPMPRNYLLLFGFTRPLLAPQRQHQHSRNQRQQGACGAHDDACNCACDNDTHRTGATSLLTHLIMHTH